MALSEGGDRENTISQKSTSMGFYRFLRTQIGRRTRISPKNLSFSDANFTFEVPILDQNHDTLYSDPKFSAEILGLRFRFFRVLWSIWTP